MAAQQTHGGFGRHTEIKPQPLPPCDNNQTNHLVGSVSPWGPQARWQNHVFQGAL